MKYRFILYISLALFLVSFEYSIIRPASTSFFIHNYTASFFPIVWIATVPINFFVVSLYNRYLPKYGTIKFFFAIISISMFINTFSVFYIEKLHFLSFIQFLWKDIYILFMYKQILSLVNASIDSKKAKFLYGFIFTMSGIGGIIGGLIPGFLATSFGSSKLFLFTPIVYTIVFFLYLSANKYTYIEEKIKNFKEKNSFEILKMSKYLVSILLLVLFMQMSVTIIDYQFNLFLEKYIHNIDARTEYIGKLISMVHIVTTFLQLFGAVFIIKFLGVKKTHFLIPFVLSINAFVFLIRPTLFVISYLFASIKSIDFSVFSIVKEILFLPVSDDEKFRAKAIIDVFSYRTAKAFASIFIIFLHSYKLSFLSSYLLFAIFAFWVFVLVSFFKYHKQTILS